MTGQTEPSVRSRNAWYTPPFLASHTAGRKRQDQSVRWLALFRGWAFLIGSAIFVVLSINRMSEFAWSEHRLDLVSQADNIGMPARTWLAARQGHASPIGCLSANPAWLDACDYLWYSMLPYYTKPIPKGVDPSFPYLIFVGDPRIATTIESQASHIRNYRLEAPLTPEAVLLARVNQ